MISISRRKKYVGPRNKIPKVVKPDKSGFLDQPARIILLSFAAVILVGTSLLLLPAATTDGAISIVDALFTATSATCVTGLIVLDTGGDFTLFGQIVILVLIQIGGLGIMTLSTFFAYLIIGRLSFAGRDILIDTFSQRPIADLGYLLKLVFVMTVGIELVGWLILSWRFTESYPLQQSLYLGIFHSISAFCNAGFSLFATSLEAYPDDWVFNLTFTVLIVLGGLGFFVIFDLFQNRRYMGKRFWHKLNLHSRVILVVTAILISTGAFLFFLFEYDSGLKNFSLSEKLLAALFQSVTTRTAGFNTVSISSLHAVTLFMFVVLMFIGASPGSCGGGIKTSTLAVIITSVLSRLRMVNDVNIFHRRVPEGTVSRAITLGFFASIIVVFFTILILIVEFPLSNSANTQRHFLDYLFEVVSAFGTVGLSTGVTGELSGTGKVLITLLMFIGRVGPLTFALAVQKRKEAQRFRYVKENLLVG